MAQRLVAPPSVAAMRAIKPDIRVLPAGALVWRVYFRGGTNPGAWNAFRSFGPMDARFDHHPPPRRTHPQRAILYAAPSGPTCLLEVFQGTRVIDRTTGLPALAAFATSHPLTLLDLTGQWPTRAGGSMTINSGARTMARRWSRTIYAAYPNVQGLRYASSMNANQPAFAFYERARRALPRAAALDLPLSDPGLTSMLAGAASGSGYVIV